MRTAIEDALERDFQLRLEKESQVRMRGETVEAAHPFGRAAAHGVAGECGKNVAVAKHDVTSAQERDELPFIAVGKIRGVDEAEGRGREQFALFALAGGTFDDLGGVPFAEEDPEPLQLQPALEQINLGRLAGTIQPFHRDEAAGKVELGKRL